MSEQLRYVSDEYNQQLRDLAALLCIQEAEYHPSQIIVEDIRMGWDSLGDYHCPSLRTEPVVDL